MGRMRRSGSPFFARTRFASVDASPETIGARGAGAPVMTSYPGLGAFGAPAPETTRAESSPPRKPVA